MRRIIQRVSVLALAAVLTACDGPFIFMSGGALSGTETEVPATRHLEEISDLAQLETRPEDPYSINLVYVQMDGQLYVYAGDTRTNWVQHIERNPLVRIQIGDAVYPMRAVRVNNDDELTQFAAIWASRSMFQRDPMQFEEVWLYRLHAR